MCTQTQLSKIADEVTRGAKDILGDKLRKVILYGSYARGDYNDESDIDIMVLADVKDEEVYPLKKEIRKVTSRLGLDNDILVSVFIKNHNHFYEWIDAVGFYKNVEKDGVTLYEPSTRFV